MNRSRISIAMATYNGARYIREQLDSLARQKRRPAELVISDDGSSDQTMDIVERFAAKAEFPVRVHRNERNLGYRANFLQAASYCQGELIAFCDQDDVWHDEKLLRLEHAFDDANLYLVFHNAVVSRTNETPSEPLIAGTPPFREGFANIPHALYNPQGFTQVFRSSLCRFNALWHLSSDHHWPHLPMAHDQWFFFLARLLGQIAFDDATLAAYRIHENNTYGWNTKFHAHYHRLRALASPGATSSRKLTALLQMQKVAASALTGMPRSPHTTEAKRALDEAVIVMQARTAMFREESIGRRLRCFRTFLANEGYSRLEATARTQPSRVVSDLAFLLSGPGLEAAARHLLNRRSQSSASAR